MSAFPDSSEQKRTFRSHFIPAFLSSSLEAEVHLMPDF